MDQLLQDTNTLVVSVTELAFGLVYYRIVRGRWLDRKLQVATRAEFEDMVLKGELKCISV